MNPRRVVLCFTITMAPAVAFAQPQCTSDTVCLPKSDLDKFVAIARERQCLEDEKPTFEIDPITVMHDAEGHVFYTGADPKTPHMLRMSWCHYTIEAEAKIDLVVGMKEPQHSGLRFRPKAYLSYLPLKLTRGTFESGIDAGILIDFLFIEWVNLNLAAGFRSVGAGLGFDITRNFGAYVGYAVAWTGPLHNVNTGLYFAF